MIGRLKRWWGNRRKPPAEVIDLAEKARWGEPVGAELGDFELIRTPAESIREGDYIEMVSLGGATIGLSRWQYVARTWDGGEEVRVMFYRPNSEKLGAVVYGRGQLIQVARPGEPTSEPAWERLTQWLKAGAR